MRRYFLRGMDKMQSIAAGHPLPQNLGPGVTSVITSKEIEQIGARRLTDVLEYLPGIHISPGRAGVNTIGFRGVSPESNTQILVLINNIPIRKYLVWWPTVFMEYACKKIFLTSKSFADQAPCYMVAMRRLGLLILF